MSTGPSTPYVLKKSRGVVVRRLSHENPSGADANGALSLADAETRICLVCAEPAEELICSTCKARIQGEALERKRREQRGAPN